MFQDLRHILAIAPNPTIFPPVRETVGPYECPVRMEYRAGMIVYHRLCPNLFCKTDVLEIIDKAHPCPMSRQTFLEEQDGTSHWRLAKPTPNDSYFMDRVQYECPDRLEHLSLNNANTARHSISQRVTCCEMQPQASTLQTDPAQPKARVSTCRKIGDHA